MFNDFGDYDVFLRGEKYTRLHNTTYSDALNYVWLLFSSRGLPISEFMVCKCFDGD